MLKNKKYPTKARIGILNGRYKHGLSTHPMRGIWKAQNSRCNNPKDTMHYLYGARGIKCEWTLLEACSWFDANPRPSPNHSIDRINNNGNYNVKNVRWATSEEQQANTRIKSSNTTGITGIGKDYTRGTFVAYYKGNQKRFKDLDLAIQYRKELENLETLPMSELITGRR